jgi:hypothetical protein
MVHSWSKCAARRHYGRRSLAPPRTTRSPHVHEYDEWRQRELRLATAEGNDAMQVPSTDHFVSAIAVGRALLHFGCPPDEIAKRLERP